MGNPIDNRNNFRARMDEIVRSVGDEAQGFRARNCKTRWNSNVLPLQAAETIMRLIINETQCGDHNDLRNTMASYDTENDAVRLTLSQLNIRSRDYHGDACVTNIGNVRVRIEEIRSYSFSFFNDLRSEQ
uniref:AlNc14C13G1530 protein n=1 Tax=Albugo laibachii Nc14 TaxID=890382 RepID=F0W3G2_9STRA|nr:AlNc14C13G1530 [Albugo laibachii Nc14]CCA16334.1 AlNc14C20G2109 [Albugo laibachii Nc14]|eukprot:CCA16334.1 AlNc14C20G2109 [Albugo laibachii Nc14]